LDRQINKMSEGRPQIIGPDSGPEPPFPLRMGGKVVGGFGRGSKEVCLFSSLRSLPPFNIPSALPSLISKSGGDGTRRIIEHRILTTTARYPDRKHTSRRRLLDRNCRIRCLLWLGRHPAPALAPRPHEKEPRLNSAIHKPHAHQSFPSINHLPFRALSTSSRSRERMEVIPHGDVYWL
jgi:hypothetical protein